MRVDTRPLFPRLRAELAVLLAGLYGGDWALPTACPGWSVHAVAAHLLGVELGNVSVRRDSWALGPGEGEDLDVWLNAFNEQWVDAARRISPALLVELIDLAGLASRSAWLRSISTPWAARCPGRPAQTRHRSGSMSPASTWSGTSTSSRSATLRGAPGSGQRSPARCWPRPRTRFPWPLTG